eukprot:7255138-Prymnesium_polylepis.2
MRPQSRRGQAHARAARACFDTAASSASIFPLALSVRLSFDSAPPSVRNETTRPRELSCAPSGSVTDMYGSKVTETRWHSGQTTFDL